ncbi:MAG TPA: preprotein translocase subunit YajC [Burkholderiales bacterium]|nr:preprotein translocase subunit YajC [Burkholderiales bacterium]
MDWIGLMPLVLLFVLLYFLMIRPQMKRAKEHKAMTEALQKGDEVITGGGVLGRITRVGGNYVTLEVAENVEIQVQKAAIQTLLPKGTIKSIE